MTSESTIPNDLSGEPNRNDVNALQDRLDTLWQKYLDHLDQYQKAQAELQKELSAVRLLYLRQDQI